MPKIQVKFFKPPLTEQFARRQVWLFSAYISVVAAINMFQMNFLVTKQPFRCALPAAVEER